MPLHVASQRNNEQIVEALIKAGADVNIVSYYQTSYKLRKLMYISSYDNDDRMILKDKIL